MSGICYTCKRTECFNIMDGLKSCDFYEGGETNWERCFGTPERAAASLANHFANCENGICSSNGIRYDEWLEWLRSDDALWPSETRWTHDQE